MSDFSRLNKFLAHTTGLSRREADEYIDEGRVLVNGHRAELGQRIAPTDLISLDGKPLKNEAATYTYLMLNKPVGYVCSRKRQGDSPTIYELLESMYHSLKPVGRLDRDSSGLLLLTDNGDFAYQMTHPSFHKNKTYEVSLDHALEPLHRQMISDIGIDLDDGKSQLQLERLEEDNDRAWKVSMHEGRNRQIRRTFAALGYRVTRLHRTHFGNYSLDALEVGKYIRTTS